SPCAGGGGKVEARSHPRCRISRLPGPRSCRPSGRQQRTAWRYRFDRWEWGFARPARRPGVPPAPGASSTRRGAARTPSNRGGLISSETRINDRIRVPEVRLVGPNGEQVGIVRIEDALRLAQEADLDLVEVAPQARPPVCKLM